MKLTRIEEIGRGVFGIVDRDDEGNIYARKTSDNVSFIILSID